MAGRRENDVSLSEEWASVRRSSGVFLSVSLTSIRRIEALFTYKGSYVWSVNRALAPSVEKSAVASENKCFRVGDVGIRGNMRDLVQMDTTVAHWIDLVGPAKHFVIQLYSKWPCHAGDSACYTIILILGPVGRGITVEIQGSPVVCYIKLGAGNEFLDKSRLLWHSVSIY